MAKHNELGKIGEEIAVKYLKSKGFKTIDRNYRLYYGEIDIIAEKDNCVTFFEVKTVSKSNYEGLSSDSFRPEDNMHSKKLERLYKAIQIYLVEKNIKKDWNLELVTVKYDQNNKKAFVNRLEIT